MRTHVLKTWPGPFEAILDGRKSFEFRRNDRAFEVGDFLDLREWEPDQTPGWRPGRETGRRVVARVTYITHGTQFGIPDGFCCMSIDVIQHKLSEEAE